MAQAYIQEGDHARALESVRTGLCRAPKDTRLLLTEAELLAALGDFAEAEACIRAQLMLGEEHALLAAADLTVFGFRSRHLLAELLLYQGRPEEATTEARQICADRPAFGYAWLTLGRALLEQPDDDAFDALCAELGSSPPARLLGTALHAYRSIRDGNAEGAARSLEETLVEVPEEPALLRALARAVSENPARSSQLGDVTRRVLAREPLCFEILAMRRAHPFNVNVARETLSSRLALAVTPMVSRDL
jgi:predicted Zn-dependent protease